MDLERNRNREVTHLDITEAHVASGRVSDFKHLSDLSIRGCQCKTITAFVIAVIESNGCTAENCFRCKPGIFVQSLVDGKGYIQSPKYTKRFHILTEDELISDKQQTGKNEPHPESGI